jgi:uncharacterized protein with ACT and thioredoxin-like domain
VFISRLLNQSILGGSVSLTVIIHIILDVLGIIAIIAGLIGGIITMFKEVRREVEARRLSVDTLPTTFIEALTQLVQALTRAPVWLALVIIGILLVFGSNVIQ